MLVSSLFAFAFLSLALGSPYKRAESLEVKVTGPADAVSSIDDLKLAATVSNTGTEDVRILKYGTILDDSLPTRSFTVTKDGAEVTFTGVKLSVSLEDADQSAYVVIPAGQTVTTTHAVASLFDFESAGTGTFSFEPVTNFMLTSPQAKVSSVVDLEKVQVASSAATVKVSGDIKKRSLPELNKRAVDICTTASRKSFIDASYSEAKSLASLASSYIASNGASNSLYVAYYGASSTTTVRNVFSRVASESSSSRTLSCVDSFGVCSGGVIAYTVISTTNIYYCSIFFNEVASSRLCSGTTVASRNVRGGTTLHEMTHATSGTDDVIYGCANDQALSDANSVRNADNYNCFSTQVYANTQC